MDKNHLELVDAAWLAFWSVMNLESELLHVLQRLSEQTNVGFDAEDVASLNDRKHSLDRQMHILRCSALWQELAVVASQPE